MSEEHESIIHQPNGEIIRYHLRHLSGKYKWMTLIDNTYLVDPNYEDEFKKKCRAN